MDHKVGLDRKLWSRASALIRKTDMTNDEVPLEVLKCAQQLHELGTTPEAYAKNADDALRFTLGLIAKKALELGQEPNTETMPMLLHRVSVRLMALPDLSESARSQTQRFVELVSSSEPMKCFLDRPRVSQSA